MCLSNYLGAKKSDFKIKKGKTKTSKSGERNNGKWTKQKTQSVTSWQVGVFRQFVLALDISEILENPPIPHEGTYHFYHATW